MVLSIAPDIGHELLSFCRQIAAGLDYLSKKHFVHRDLAARNILLSDDYVCKVRMHNIATYSVYIIIIIMCVSSSCRYIHFIGYYSYYYVIVHYIDIMTSSHCDHCIYYREPWRDLY